MDPPRHRAAIGFEQNLGGGNPIKNCQSGARLAKSACRLTAIDG